MRVVVLGAGMVGRAIALDLARDAGFDVTAVDASREALDGIAGTEGVQTERLDLSQEDVVRDVAGRHDLVVCAVPGHMGFATVRACLEGGAHVVDIAFAPEDPYELDGLARGEGLVCLTDFGLAPGCSNLLLGHALATHASVDRFACYVGGVPVDRRLPWEYKAPFSPVDVLEEYTRPARFVEDGRVVTRPALSDPELVHFDGVGSFEAFLTDGLRTLLRETGVRHMVEKTCRYPGHRDRIAFLRDAGLLATEPVQLADGQSVRPFDVTAQVLLDAWRLGPEEPELTVMRVEAAGQTADGAPWSRRWEMQDRFDPATGISSMARTTGYACTAGVRLVAQGLWTRPGVAPPELVGRDGACFEFVMGELAARGVHYRVVD